jgi:hypothetical protein
MLYLSLGEVEIILRIKGVEGLTKLGVKKGIIIKI